MNVFLGFWLYVVALNISECESAATSSELFGPYKAKTAYVEKCDSSKKQKIIADANVTLLDNDRGDQTVTAFYEMYNDAGPLSIKYEAMMLNSKSFRKPFVYEFKNVCTICTRCIKFIQQLLKFKTTDSSCIVEKTPTRKLTFETNHFIHMLVGDKFFYGQYKFTARLRVPNYKPICYRGEIGVEKIQRGKGQL